MDNLAYVAHFPPFCSVSVDVCGFTFATRPSTTVLGGFWSVTVTEIPISAMFADTRFTRDDKACSSPGDAMWCGGCRGVSVQGDVACGQLPFPKVS